MRHIGIVLKWKEDSGFGFLLFEDRQVFFHYSQLPKLIEPFVGQVVSFEFAPSYKPGMPDQAVKIRPASKEERDEVARQMAKQVADSNLLAGLKALAEPPKQESVKAVQS